MPTSTSARSAGLSVPSAFHFLSAMSRAHREILHLARLLARIVEDLPSEKIDRYLIRDAQRVIEAVETLVRIHTAQEEDIYDAIVAR
jgi:hypothetical protein